MSRYRIRLTGTLEADSMNDVHAVLADLEASAEVDGGLTDVSAVLVEEGDDDGDR